MMNKKITHLSAKLIAPCGMDCSICQAFLREEKKCPGCRIKKLKCAIKNCSKYKKNKFEFCYMCPVFPCDRINHLEKRYNTRYDYSMIESLETIKNSGLEKFIKDHEKKYSCNDGKGIICVHDKKCYKK